MVFLEILRGRGHHCLYAALQLDDAGDIISNGAQKPHIMKVALEGSVKKRGVASYDLIERSIRVEGINPGIRARDELYRARRGEYLALKSGR